MAYITVNDIKDKTINNAITQSNWTDTDLQIRIDEAEAIVDSYLIKAGYNKSDLENCVLVKKICVLLAKYNVLRDLYANVMIDKSENMGFIRWKEEAIKLLEAIQQRKISLVNTNGNVIYYDTKKDLPVINTEDTKRIFKIGDSVKWSKPDYTYIDEDVIGNK